MKEISLKDKNNTCTELNRKTDFCKLVIEFLQKSYNLQVISLTVLRKILILKEKCKNLHALGVENIYNSEK